MNYHVLTLFPDMIYTTLNTSVIGRAIENKFIHIHAVDIRDYSNNKHKQVDDYPYGGGAGMVMKPEPVYNAYHHVQEQIGKPARVVYLTPQGTVFNQKIAKELAQEEDLIFLCGHYEGIDERVLEMIVTDYISIGDYILTGGELPTMVMIDAISRLVDGVLNNEMSSEFETFHDNLLEYPQYTRPSVFMDKAVPEVLLSGHHGNVDKWRREQSLIRTQFHRPDMLAKAELTEEEGKFLTSMSKNS